MKNTQKKTYKLPPTNDTEVGGAYAWFVVGMLLLAYCLSFIDRQIISLMVAPIRADLAITDFQFSLLNLAFAVFFALFGLPLGRLVDSRNRRNIIIVGMVAWSAMTALSGLAKQFSTLFLARIGVGIGEASLSPAAYSILSDYFPPEKLARPMAVFSMGSTIGTGLALIIGGAVVAYVQSAGDVSLPVLGIVRPWQLAFFIVGIPGIVFSLLFFFVREPHRTGLIFDKGKAMKEPPAIAAVARYVMDRRRVYLPHFIATSLLTGMSSGNILWYPSFLGRTHGWDMASAGYSFGLIFLFAGSAGVLAGGWLSTRYSQQGRADANMRVMAIACSLAILPYATGPLMPGANQALVLLAIAVFATQMMAGVSVAAIQVITPNQMRGQVSALFLFTVNLIGFGLGAPSIAIITDFVFGDDAMLRYSMSIASLLIVPLCALLLWRTRAAYSAAVERALQEFNRR